MAQPSESVRDNAVSSVLRLCRHLPPVGGLFDAGRLLPVALGWLPLRHDLQEAHACHAHLVDWIAASLQQQDASAAVLLGEAGGNMGRLVQVLAALMGT